MISNAGGARRIKGVSWLSGIKSNSILHPTQLTLGQYATTTRSKTESRKRKTALDHIVLIQYASPSSNDVYGTE